LIRSSTAFLRSVEVARALGDVLLQRLLGELEEGFVRALERVGGEGLEGVLELRLGLVEELLLLSSDLRASELARAGPLGIALADEPGEREAHRERRDRVDASIMSPPLSPAAGRSA
jgi:hypothetical protein